LSPLKGASTSEETDNVPILNIHPEYPSQKLSAWNNGFLNGMKPVTLLDDFSACAAEPLGVLPSKPNRSV